MSDSSYASNVTNWRDSFRTAGGNQSSPIDYSFLQDEEGSLQDIPGTNMEYINTPRYYGITSGEYRNIAGRYRNASIAYAHKADEYAKLTDEYATAAAKFAKASVEYENVAVECANIADEYMNIAGVGENSSVGQVYGRDAYSFQYGNATVVHSTTPVEYLNAYIQHPNVSGTASNATDLYLCNDCAPYMNSLVQHNNVAGQYVNTSNVYGNSSTNYMNARPSGVNGSASSENANLNNEYVNSTSEQERVMQPSMNTMASSNQEVPISTNTEQEVNVDNFVEYTIDLNTLQDAPAGFHLTDNENAEDWTVLETSEGLMLIYKVRGSDEYFGIPLQSEESPAEENQESVNVSQLINEDSPMLLGYENTATVDVNDSSQIEVAVKNGSINLSDLIDVNSDTSSIISSSPAISDSYCYLSDEELSIPFQTEPKEEEINLNDDNEIEYLQEEYLHYEYDPSEEVTDPSNISSSFPILSKEQVTLDYHETAIINIDPENVTENNIADSKENNTPVTERRRSRKQVLIPLDRTDSEIVFLKTITRKKQKPLISDDDNKMHLVNPKRKYVKSGKYRKGTHAPPQRKRKRESSKRLIKKPKISKAYENKAHALQSLKKTLDKLNGPSTSKSYVQLDETSSTSLSNYQLFTKHKKERRYKKLRSSNKNENIISNGKESNDEGISLSKESDDGNDTNSLTDILLNLNNDLDSDVHSSTPFVPQSSITANTDKIDTVNITKLRDMVLETSGPAAGEMNQEAERKQTPKPRTSSRNKQPINPLKRSARFDLPTVSSKKCKVNEANVVNIENKMQLRQGIFKCKFCDRCFRMQGQLIQHENTHNTVNIKLNKCTQCLQEFAFKYALNAHAKICQKQAKAKDIKKGTKKVEMKKIGFTETKPKPKSVQRKSSGKRNGKTRQSTRKT